MGIRTMIADDHQLVLDGLSAVLANQSDIDLIGTATDGSQAVELAAATQPDIAILDVTMPTINGIEALRQIRRCSPDTEIIFLSMHAAPQVVTDALAAGAAGYVVKGASVHELVIAIRTVMGGETFLSSQIVDAVPAHLLRRAPVPGENPSPALTPREIDVLRLLANGLSSKQIATRLYVTTKTIVWHRQSIMAKLGLRTVPELTKYAVRMGFTSLD